MSVPSVYQSMLVSLLMRLYLGVTNAWRHEGLGRRIIMLHSLLQGSNPSRLQTQYSHLPIPPLSCTAPPTRALFSRTLAASSNGKETLARAVLLYTIPTTQHLVSSL